jgi:hypothetical protein
MTTRGRITLPALLGIATVFGVSSTFQAYWLSQPFWPPSSSSWRRNTRFGAAG